MSFNDYYQSELTALRQMGRTFSERNPALAPFLGQSGRDPDVERLLEGVAFLTGRLRQKLDDEWPELTHSLMQLLWPNYMRPLPSFSIVQFQPLDQAGPAVHIERQTPINSEKVEGVNCRFRTCFATEVQPLELSDLNYSVQGEGALLSLQLTLKGSGHLGQLTLDRLRLHFAGERYISQTLYLNMLRNLGSIEVVLLDAEHKPLKPDGDSVTSFKLQATDVEPVGFADDHALIPYPLNTFRGYRYLQEYFALQDKFLFVDVKGLEPISAMPEDMLKQSVGFELRFTIKKNAIQRARPARDNIRLYCTPVVNLFNEDALPIRLDGKQDEYLLLPSRFEQKHCGVYSIESVIGREQTRGGERHYVPFESFKHDPSFDVLQASPYYSVRQRSSLSHSGLDTYLSFDIRHCDRQEALSIDLVCTNQNLPLRLRDGDICISGEGAPETAGFRNITACTPHYAPPLTENFLWKLISNMSLNYLSLENVDALKVILETYDFPQYYDRNAASVTRKMLGGLKSIRHVATDRLFGGLPLRGVRTELMIDSEQFICEGDVFVFSSVLNEFFALYTSLNSFHELRVKTIKGEVYAWTPRMGQQPLL
ncbi:type VI secretion system baseplate subunit TssF [Pseudomonas syringae]|jgi:type VI secretion system protein ImpG|uniref:Type VI secretion protein n=1 Tax=Pseudomonas syringae TaxID=317 RepID=A0A085UZZ3_PSESX|nr:type VI secretion system baseplate subunit TssF [Pseudomonas syringae]KFE48756.1 type VI secretion protein [Pseudomonas syringae]